MERLWHERVLSDKLANSCYMYFLVVNEEYRGRGIGTATMQMIERIVSDFDLADATLRYFRPSLTEPHQSSWTRARLPMWASLSLSVFRLITLCRLHGIQD